MIKFTVFQHPTGKQSPRFASRGGMTFKYKSTTQKLNETTLMAEMLKHRPSKPMTGAIKLVLTAYFRIPVTKPAWWREAALQGIIEPTVKPDDDNIRKQYADIMTKLQFWGDDKQITEGITKKIYAEIPRIEIEISEKYQPKLKKDINNGPNRDDATAD